MKIHNDALEGVKPEAQRSGNIAVIRISQSFSREFSLMRNMA